MGKNNRGRAYSVAVAYFADDVEVVLLVGSEGELSTEEEVEDHSGRPNVRGLYLRMDSRQKIRSNLKRWQAAAVAVRGLGGYLAAVCLLFVLGVQNLWGAVACCANVAMRVRMDVALKAQRLLKPQTLH
jgi:hypothetical protein